MNLCSSCTNIGCEFQSGIVRTECVFYMPPHIKSDNCGNYVVMQPTTGHWIFVDKAKEHAHCSECGYGNVDLFDGRPHNYCPNCGAKMTEPEESEDDV